MVHSRPLSPLQLEMSTNNNWAETEGDTVYPAQSRRLNGHIGDDGITSHLDGILVSDMSQDSRVST